MKNTSVMDIVYRYMNMSESIMSLLNDKPRRGVLDNMSICIWLSYMKEGSFHTHAQLNNRSISQDIFKACHCSCKSLAFQ